MIALFTREECSACGRVRQWLGRRQIAYQAVPVPSLRSERQALAELTGGQASVPVLKEGDRVVAGEEAIIAYLEERFGRDAYGDPLYGLTRCLGKVDFTAAHQATLEALATEGFGVLTEIDVQATMKKKLDVEFQPYLILGACNPPLAHQALTAEPGLGLLLPCNLVLTQEGDGSVVVSAADPVVLFSITSNPARQALAETVRDKLARVLGRIEVRADG
ncbi:MAG: DUF302 domain-containing protein [Bradymonadales bacterium]|nr:DUF302 domain-containing protein [Bradymonadales bacterium]